MGNLIKMPHSELNATIEILDSLGVEPKNFERVRKDRVFAERVAEAFRAESQATKTIFSVIVDYSLSLKEMIAAGKYDWSNKDITADHFSVVGRGKLEVELALVLFNRVMSSDDVFREFENHGLRPAKIEELLALGAQYPDLQRQFPIAALGSVWRSLFGYRGVPCLDGRGVGRDLYLYWLEDGWRESWRFLAVRKS